MDSPWDELALAFSRTSMFPFFDIAHYLVSVMAVKRQPGAAALAWKNPISSWFTAMLHCFGGGILSCLLLAEPPLKFLANHTNILLASSICPAKVTLLGSVIFTFQHTQHLAISKHNLMFLYTIFIVATKITMMTTQTSTMTFAPFEDTLSWMLFGWQQPFSSCEKKSEAKSPSNGVGSLASKPVDVASDNVKKKHTKKNE
ncbi:trimeric intracellular cation channel type B isoform X3 [Homo sapiens]|uniref:trimeric intracellular cation channel type B isoform X3 n=1 Tax=Homo sapiens TaxID=9606 RepID=UPI0001EE1C31|nr:trimeric intracellular cation channel type B isoform X3 [Homo sapiens]XP_054219190.1 trimeric intracellular cation channel type B isoform X3 [Homo sapiens]|eukprot:XP_011517134.1 trimeric intracellular cation channel type B isoform X5 [Homo sapiens]